MVPLISRVRTADSMGPIVLIWITAARRSNYKACDEITYPFPNLNGAAAEVWELISNFNPHVLSWACDYLSMSGLQLSHVKGAPDVMARKRARYYFLWGESIGHDPLTHLTHVRYCGGPLFSFMFIRTKCWTNSPVVGGLRRQHAHMMSL